MNKNSMYGNLITPINQLIKQCQSTSTINKCFLFESDINGMKKDTEYTETKN